MNIEFTPYEGELLWKLLDSTALAQSTPTEQRRWERIRDKFTAFDGRKKFDFVARDKAIEEFFAATPSPTTQQLESFARSLKGPLYSHTTFVGDIVRSIGRVRRRSAGVLAS